MHWVVRTCRSLRSTGRNASRWAGSRQWRISPPSARPAGPLVLDSSTRGRRGLCSTASPLYIESNVSFEERGTRTLKSGCALALFDHRGDIVAGEGNSDGIYLQVTRVMSRLELRLNGGRVLLLSSNVQEDNGVLTVE